MAANPEHNKEVVEAYIADVINGGMFTQRPPSMEELLRGLEKYIAPDGYDHNTGAVGPQGELQVLGLMGGAFPDSHFEMKLLAAEDDLVTSVGALSGTHMGALLGMPPTGRRFAVHAIQTLRLENDKFVEHWGGISLISLLRQLGLYEQVLAGPKAELLKEMGRKYIDAINNDDFDLLAEVTDENFVDRAARRIPGLPPGIEGVKAVHLMLRGGFPDLRFTIEDVMVEDDTLVMVTRGHGTNTGSLFGIPPTGKQASWTGMRILRAKNGKFVSGTSEFDQVGILQQMGIVPSFAPPVDLEANKALIRRLYEEENKGNVDIIDELMAPDIVIHGDALAPYQKGTQTIKEQVNAVKDVFEDLTVTIDDLVADGNRVAAALSWKGRHVKDFMGVPASGREITWSAIAINRIENGKVAERWFVASTFNLLQQLGMIPSMDGGGQPPSQ